jgi:hypothetical protein
VQQNRLPFFAGIAWAVGRRRGISCAGISETTLQPSAVDISPGFESLCCGWFEPAKALKAKVYFATSTPGAGLNESNGLLPKGYRLLL